MNREMRKMLTKMTDAQSVYGIQRGGGAGMDFHVHTDYCDGKNTAEEMICAAIEKGMAAIGFSGHSYTDFDKAGCMSIEGGEEYKQEVRRLADKYKEKIKVFCGIERDFYSSENANDWDYVIGSVHYLELDQAGGSDEIGGKAYPSVDETPEVLEKAAKDYFDGDFYSLAEEYFRTISEVVQKTNADIIGHFDLVCKFNKGGEAQGAGKYFDEQDPRYIAAWKKAADALLRTDALFEINTGAVSGGYRSDPYPSAPIREYIRNNGGKFIVSSDSHRAETLCYSEFQMK